MCRSFRVHFECPSVMINLHLIKSPAAENPNSWGGEGVKGNWSWVLLVRSFYPQLFSRPGALPDSGWRSCPVGSEWLPWTSAWERSPPAGAWTRDLHSVPVIDVMLFDMWVISTSGALDMNWWNHITLKAFNGLRHSGYTGSNLTI